jgi:hypothetical protein
LLFLAAVFLVVVIESGPPRRNGSTGIDNRLADPVKSTLEPHPLFAHSGDASTSYLQDA